MLAHEPVGSIGEEERKRMVLKVKFLIICIFGFVMLMAGIGINSSSAMETDDCLGCHGDSSIIDEGGERLYIDGAQFAGTKHAEDGCGSCHFVTDDHPDDGIRPGKESCDTCHEDTIDELSKGLHAGNAECTDCHNPHAAKGLKPPGESCGMCHEDAVEEYLKSPHAEKAACSDCHSPHTVKSHLSISGFEKNRRCATCHDNVGHSEWLLRSRLHMQATTCISCHTDSKGIVIAMYIEKRDGVRPDKEGEIDLATYEDLMQLVGDGGVQSLIDTNGDGSITMAELKDFNKNSKYQDVGLWGVLSTETASHSYGIFEDRRDCSFCHAAGPKAMQTCYVAFPNQDGTYSRVAVEEGAVLDPLFATPDFYMVGSTRNDILSILGLLIIAGGLGAASLHGTFRFLTRKNRRKH
ncbi:MAG: cytochrome C [Deltaproteobacteria bacterium]|nr:cytochrome C [Deltaproteobacteria bacterium]MBW1966003.1 cytochrome C [Deltaproteobacteria bacterium]MBW2097398.1 cytochrome C [Deltaproteobacteria bacterium]RKX58883.1 MAG: cytochrome C [Thermodesulfobacteriota bacterium]